MSELKLYNTLTRSKEVFTPIDANNVRLYACGPTVYDFAHIGNARPVIVFDVLFRLLRHVYGEKHVTYVRNITDVDDKINARALRDFPDLPLNDAIARVTAKTADQFHEDVKALGCLEPTHEPRATEHIEGMVDIIQLLLDGEHAYVAKGTEGREVLFSINSMVNERGEIEYGKLSGRKLEDQQAGARIAVEEHKRNPGDFVLWKESGANMPGWKGEFIPDSKAGYQADLVMSEQNRKQLQANSRKITIFGRPGWHIECSAMSNTLLWENLKGNLSENALKHPHQFDIHAGGLDLIFPHHENEIAQSRCAHGTAVMANVWMHNGFLQVEGRKMSKSEGNFVTIHELLHTEKFGGRKWPGEVLRLAMLMTHYREPIDFSVRRLEEAEKILNGLYRAFEKIWPVTPSSELNHFVFNDLLDDLSTSSAIKSLAWETRVENLAKEKLNVGALGVAVNDKAEQILAAGQILGILKFSPQQWFQGEFPTITSSLNVTEAGDTLFAHGSVNDTPLSLKIEERLAFLAAKNFAEADRIRDELLAQGIQLKDSKDSVTGERVTSWEVKR